MSYYLSNSTIGELQIVLSTIFFGLSFVGMRKAATTTALGPISFQTFRCLVSLIAIGLARKRLKKIISTDVDNTDKEDNKVLLKLKSTLPSGVSQYNFDLIFWGLCCGLLTFLISICEQVGVETVPAGKACFINGMFVVITPVIEHLLPCYHVPIPSVTWVAILLSIAGMYFLAYPSATHDDDQATEESQDYFSGEMILLLSTLLTCLDILCADAGAKRVDTVDFTLVQFASSATVALMAALLIEPDYWSWPMSVLMQCWPLVLFVGVTEGFGYTFGSIGQMYVKILTDVTCGTCMCADDNSQPRHVTAVVLCFF
jgi:drug/metabolite transporter (DMT)-like permease